MILFVSNAMLQPNIDLQLLNDQDFLIKNFTNQPIIDIEKKQILKYDHLFFLSFIYQINKLSEKTGKSFENHYIYEKYYFFFWKEYFVVSIELFDPNAPIQNTRSATVNIFFNKKGQNVFSNIFYNYDTDQQRSPVILKYFGFLDNKNIFTLVYPYIKDNDPSKLEPEVFAGSCHYEIYNNGIKIVKGETKRLPDQKFKEIQTFDPYKGDEYIIEAKPEQVQNFLSMIFFHKYKMHGFFILAVSISLVLTIYQIKKKKKNNDIIEATTN